MKIAFISALLLGFAAAAPVLEERAANNYKKVVADIETIKKQTLALTKTLKSLTATDPTGQAAVLMDTNSLETDLQNATSDAKASGPFGKTGSNAVAAAVLGLIGPTEASLKELVKKKPDFKAGPISEAPIVLMSLKTLKSDTDAFGKAVAAKLDKEYKSTAPAIQKSIDQAFEKAIKAYSSGGTIPI